MSIRRALFSVGTLLSVVVFAAVICLTLPISACAAGEPKKISLQGTAPDNSVFHVKLPSGERTVSIAEIERLPTYEVKTRTFWPEDDGVYEGVLLSDFLKSVGLDNALAIKVTAIDGFSQIIPAEDWRQWPVLLATRRNGTLLTRREKGPARIIYPRDMNKKLEESIYRLRWVWLIKSIEKAEH